MSTKIFLNLNLNLIQNIRFMHALTESDYIVVIPTDDELKFKELKRVFGVQYTTNGVNGYAFDNYKILHNKPLTQLGSIQKGLIFPHAIVDFCKSLWKDERTILCSFAGLITDKRKEALTGYINNNYTNKYIQTINTNTVYKSMINRIKHFFRMNQNISQTTIGEIVFWSSNRGRTFPIKAWDEDYFQLLSNSKFVLCPNGDFIWTYRFFEAILCGAIPIVEDHCSLYDGFRYKTFDDDLKILTWNKEDAEFNYKLCVERLTIPTEELNLEIDLLLNKN